MAFIPNPNFAMPKPSRRQALLENHGYYEGAMYNTDEGVVHVLTPTQWKYKELCDWEEEPTDDELTTCYVYGRHEFDLKSEAGEKFSEWMLRLGWLVRNDEGKLVEA